ncbi:MAG: hypothetical protein WCI86_03735, partial [Actinomycetota bacterium]
MKKILSIVALAISSVLVAQSSSALQDDEQWKKPTNFKTGFHEVLFEEGIAPLDVFPHLWGEGSFGRRICKSIDDGDCSKSTSYSYTAIYPVCLESTSLDCVESLEAIKPDGTIEKAIFKRYSAPTHENLFSPSAKLGIPKTATPGLWEFPNLQHAKGKTFVVDLGINGKYQTANHSTGHAKDLFGYVVPSAVLKGGNLHKYEYCKQGAVDPIGNTNTECIISPETAGDTRCFMSLEENNDCLMRVAFPEDIKFRVTARLSSEPAAWLHGRMVDPKISIQKIDGDAVKLIVEAGSTKVPVLYQGNFWNNLSAAGKEFWTFCKISGDNCGTIAAADETGAMNYSADEEKSYKSSLMINYGTIALYALNTFAKLVGDKANAVPSTWSFHALSANEMAKSSACISDGKGLKGIVTTNSTTYSEGPPTFIKGNLEYSVASPHFAPDGITPLKGSYNLVMRSDIARCFYNFTSAPISATISIVNTDGSSQVATTVVNENSGWLSLAANGFTYSNPTVKVKLSQAKKTTTSPSPEPSAAPIVSKMTSITCVKGKTTKKVTAVSPTC